MPGDGARRVTRGMARACRPRARRSQGPLWLVWVKRPEHWVVYLREAVHGDGPLPSCLRGVHQPVMRSSIEVSGPRAAAVELAERVLASYDATALTEPPDLTGM